MRLSPRHAVRPPSPVSSALLRAQALLVLMVLNAGIAVAAKGPQAGRIGESLAAHAAAPSSEPVPVGIIEPSPSPKPLRVKPAPAKPPVMKIAAARLTGRNWVPTGTGMWTYMWRETEGGKARAVVRRARAAGLTHLYVRTGTRKGGFDGGPVLARLLPLTRGTNLKVIAWDFPTLANPIADARRLAAAANFRAPGTGTPRVAAVAPDIETGAEGTHISGPAVATYLTELRRLIPKDTPIFGVIPWPSEKRLGKYPYSSVAKRVDALVPMAYWINRDPVVVTRQTMRRLKVYGKPIMPVGQAYDPRIDVPTLQLGPPSQAQIDAFLATARKEGAPAASLWVWQFAKPGHWTAVSSARNRFDGVTVTRRP